MKRSMMQAYVRGSATAVPLYQRAFGAVLQAAYEGENGAYEHAELNIEGHILAVSEAMEGRRTGNAMQFCLQFDDGSQRRIDAIFEALYDGGALYSRPGPCPFSPYMASFVDRFGVYWCLFV